MTGLGLGRFETWAKSSDPGIDDALKQLALAVLRCTDADELMRLEQRLTRFGSSASSQATVVRNADAAKRELEKHKRDERNRKARDRRAQQTLATPLSDMISDRLMRRRR